jgi:hypothetical protein
MIILEAMGYPDEKRDQNAEQEAKRGEGQTH